MGPTTFSTQALLFLRRPEMTFQWYIIPLFSLVSYIYICEIEKKNFRVVYASLAYWGMDLINELINSLVFHFSNFAPIWGAPGKSAWQFLIGLNIEITFMFALSGLGFVKLLPADKNLKIMGINNRLFFASINTLFCVLVEIWLNSINVLTWEYPWWSAKMPILIFLFGYLPFNLVCFYVYDLPTDKSRKSFIIKLWGVIIGGYLLCGPILGWL